MFNRFKKILFSVPSMTVIGITAAYMLLGFLVLPAIAKWQLEKQFADRGHVLRLQALRFNPLELRLEADQLQLQDAAGKPMLAFAALVVDLQWRSIIDGAWTFADLRLREPVLHVELAKDGRHNFSDLMDRFASAEASEPPTGDLPSVLVEQLVVARGRLDYADQALEVPLVSRVTALNIDARGLSTLRDQLTDYRVSVLTEAGESVDLSGQLGLNPLLAKGELALDKLQLSTVARALSRQLALQAAGTVRLSAGFDLAMDAQAALTGQLRAIDLGSSGLSLQVPGASVPLLAAKTMSLGGGVVDLAQRDVRFAQFRLGDGGVALALDAQGRGDWSGIVRASAPPGTAATTAAPDKPAAAATAPEGAPWRVAIDDARIDAMAIDFRDTANKRSASLAALGLAVAPSMTLGAANSQLALDKLQLQLSGLQLSDGASAVAMAALTVAAAPSLTLNAGGSQLAMDKLQLELSGLQLGEGASSVSIPVTRFDLGQTALTVLGDAVKGSIDTPRLALAQGLTANDGQRQASVGATTLETGLVTMSSTGGATANTRLGIAAPQLKVVAALATQKGQSAKVDTYTWRAQQMTLGSGGDGQTLAMEAVALALQGLQASADGQELAIAALTLESPSLSSSQTEKGLQLQARKPVLLLTDVQAQGGSEERASLASLRLEGSTVAVSSQPATTALTFAGLLATGTTLALQRADEQLDLAGLVLGGESLSLTLDDAGITVAGGKAQASATGVLARQGGNTASLRQAGLQVAAVDAASAPAAGVPASTRAQLQSTVLTLEALTLDGDGAPLGRASLSGMKLSAGDLALAQEQGPLVLTGRQIDLQLDGAVLRDPADASLSLLQLGSAAASGAAVDLAQRLISIDKLVLDQATAALWLDPQGQLNLVDRFVPGSADAPVQVTAIAAATDAPQVPGSAAEATTSSPAPVSAATPWRVVVGAAELNNSSLGFEDRRQSPPFALGLDGVGLRITALDTGGPAPAQVEVRATLASGGSLEATGVVTPLGSAADLQLSATGVTLAPIQAYLSQFVELTLASGSASTQGRLLYGDIGGNTSMLSYAGGFSVDKLLLEELAPVRPFLAWDAVRSGDLALSIEPHRLDIGEVQIDKLAGRLIIAEDQSINLTDVLKKRPAAEVQEGAAVVESPTPAADDPFPVTIARVRVADSQLEFADLSLRPQFGTRMHGLKGVITGLGTDANRSAKLQLDAQVDQFGSARIRGQVSVFQPERLTDIEMAFRNLEMKAMSPYSAKFAGYEIASGKLSLDLQYKVRDGKLLGENKVVLNQLELGKKVESPDALDLPLDLALAILKDSKGVIDIGLPVRGDLDDPQFDYGAVIAKAIGNLLGGIVTAPFRALASLFGGGSDSEIDTIAFEPGGDHLAPPEHQKLETVARALKERPNLKLKVDPVFAPAQDTPALQSLLVRSALIRRMGLEVVEGEDPGPIDAANPRVPVAVEAEFSARYAPQVLAVLKQRALAELAPAQAPTPAASAAAAAPGNAAPAPAPRPAASAPAAQSAGAAAPPQPPRVPPPAFYQGLIDRMVKEQVVSDVMLGQLATRRADAVVQVLTGDNGVAPERVERGETRKSEQASDTVVPLKLQLEVVP